VHVALVYPPFGDPRAPQLALPSLAAYLRAAAVSVSLFDANIEAFEDLACPERLAEIGETLRARVAASRSLENLRAQTIAERLPETVPHAFSTLRDPNRFFDAPAYASARRVIYALLHAASLASGVVDVGLAPIRYKIAGFDTARLADLIGATERPENDLFREATSRLVARIGVLNPTLVGITITNHQQIYPGLILARRLRNNGHFVVIGGALYTKFAEALARLPEFFNVFADAVVVYEGETALLALAHARAGTGELKDVPNMLFTDKRRVIKTHIHLENVSALPTPDFSGLPLDRYLTPHPVLPILTGKGCYFNRCKFCDIPFINHISTKRYRVREPERVVDDVHTLNSRFKASHFVITDEALSAKLLLRLADSFDERPGAFSFTGYARLEPSFTPAACQRIAQFGMRKLFFGMESASQATLDHMDKGTKIEHAPQILANCRRAGIDFHLFSIVGLPEETQERARETLSFFLNHRALINSPGSSFDMHPFGLDLRTPYFNERTRYGIEIAEGALAKDLPLHVESVDWHNTRGLSQEVVKRLIDEEFLPKLRQAFSDWHAGPDPLWPPQEEYAVLYGNRFAKMPFPWRSSLPTDMEQGFTFVFDQAPAVKERGDAVGFHHPTLSFSLPRSLAQLLSSGSCSTWAEHLRSWPDAADRKIREYIQILFTLGILIIRIDEPIAQPAPLPMSNEAQDSGETREGERQCEPLELA